MFLQFLIYVASRRTLHTVGVPVYYTSKDITMSSVCLVRRRKNPALLDLFSGYRPRPADLVGGFFPVGGAVLTLVFFSTVIPASLPSTW